MTKPAVTQREKALMVAGQSRAWLVVSTKVGKEMLVLEQLKSKGFEGYRPMTAKLRRVTGQTDTVLVPMPLLRNYLFARTTVGGDYRSLFSLPGVAWIYPRGVLNSVIDRFRDLEVEEIQIGGQKYGDLQRAALTPRARYERGQAISTLDGLIQAIVDEPIDTNRVAALSSFMNGASRLTVSIDRIIPAGVSHKASA